MRHRETYGTDGPTVRDLRGHGARPPVFPSRPRLREIEGMLLACTLGAVCWIAAIECAMTLWRWIHG